MNQAVDNKSRQPYVFIIREGPSYSLIDVRATCELWARRFQGEYWTFGSYTADESVSGFRARVIDTGSWKSWRSYWRYSRQVIARVRELKADSTKSVVIVASDPFKNGLLAIYLARIVNGHSIAEINGAYGNAYAFSHISNTTLRAARLWAFRRVGSFVLKRVNGIRLLFDAQVKAFSGVRPTTVIRSFHELTHSTRFHRENDEKYILLVGYPFLVKGADFLVKAFLKITDRHPDWKLVLIGHVLAAELKKAGLEHPRVQALPAVQQTELVPWVNRCGILAQPSRTEAMGRILIEAAAAGKCRIASRVDGIPTVIEDGIDGLLVEPGNIDELARTLDMAMSDPLLRKRLGDAALARAAAGFSQDAYLANYSELIHSVLTAEPKS